MILLFIIGFQQEYNKLMKRKVATKSNQCLTQNNVSETAYNKSIESCNLNLYSKDELSTSNSTLSNCNTTTEPEEANDNSIKSLNIDKCKFML